MGRSISLADAARLLGGLSEVRELMRRGLIVRARMAGGRPVVGLWFQGAAVRRIAADIGTARNRERERIAWALIEHGHTYADVGRHLGTTPASVKTMARRHFVRMAETMYGKGWRP